MRFVQKGAHITYFPCNTLYIFQCLRQKNWLQYFATGLEWQTFGQNVKMAHFCSCSNKINCWGAKILIWVVNRTKMKKITWSTIRFVWTIFIFVHIGSTERFHFDATIGARNFVVALRHIATNVTAQHACLFVTQFNWYRLIVIMAMHMYVQFDDDIILVRSLVLVQKSMSGKKIKRSRYKILDDIENLFWI